MHCRTVATVQTIGRQGWGIQRTNASASSRKKKKQEVTPRIVAPGSDLEDMKI